jgi:hypothetical protein
MKMNFLFVLLSPILIVYLCFTMIISAAELNMIGLTINYVTVDNFTDFEIIFSIDRLKNYDVR